MFLRWLYECEYFLDFDGYFADFVHCVFDGNFVDEHFAEHCVFDENSVDEHFAEFDGNFVGVDEHSGNFVGFEQSADFDGNFVGFVGHKSGP